MVGSVRPLAAGDKMIILKTIIAFLTNYCENQLLNAIVPFSGSSVQKHQGLAAWLN